MSKPCRECGIDISTNPKTGFCLDCETHPDQNCLNTSKLADRWLTKLIEDKDFSPCDDTLCEQLDYVRQKLRIAINNYKHI